MKSRLRILYRVMESPKVYALSRLIARPTTERCRKLIDANVSTQGKLILDLGCGIGNFRDSFRGSYVGIDINAGYIDVARKQFSGTFEVMDCTELAFPDASFDEVVTIAATHHLNDGACRKMIREAFRVLRPGGHFHIVDAILPESKWAWFKWIWFRLDRGEYPRRLAAIAGLVENCGRLCHVEVVSGPLHDVAYLRAVRFSASAGDPAHAPPGVLISSGTVSTNSELPWD